MEKSDVFTAISKLLQTFKPSSEPDKEQKSEQPEQPSEKTQPSSKQKNNVFALNRTLELINSHNSLSKKIDNQNKNN